ncbi:hypothetical protein AB3X96_18055 [Paraburkholderia sp. BR13439]|uniref:hypothetical protein n=1 Tax=Paraburkholderia sp. BR13439 TaxID=3236996 RepID=UPI0034CDCD70
MNANLLSAMPAILAVAKTKRARNTGEIVVGANDLRAAAVALKCPSFTTRELGTAMKSVGAKRHSNTTCAQYVFPGALRLADAIQIAAENVDQIKQGRNR